MKKTVSKMKLSILAIAMLSICIPSTRSCVEDSAEPIVKRSGS